MALVVGAELPGTAWGVPHEEVGVGELHVHSVHWSAAVRLVEEEELEHRSSSGRSGAKFMQDVEGDSAAARPEYLLAVHALDGLRKTRGVLWAKLEHAERLVAPGAPINKIIIMRCYVSSTHRGRRPSVMQMMWEYMFGMVKCRFWRHDKPLTVQLSDRTCVLRAQDQWMHLFGQTAEIGSGYHATLQAP